MTVSGRSPIAQTSPAAADDPARPQGRHLPAFLGATVDFSYDRTPIFIQLATLFRRLIVTGQWPVGQRIPTHEHLAVQLDVNPATIDRARDGPLLREGSAATGPPAATTLAVDFGVSALLAPIRRAR